MREQQANLLLGPLTKGPIRGAGRGKEQVAQTPFSDQSRRGLEWPPGELHLLPKLGTPRFALMLPSSPRPDKEGNIQLFIVARVLSHKGDLSGSHLEDLSPRTGIFPLGETE